MAFWDPISLKNIFTYIQATPLISRPFVSDFYYVKVIELPGKAYILGEEVSLLHGFPRLRSHSRGLYIT